MKNIIKYSVSAILSIYAGSIWAQTNLMDVRSWAYQLQDINISQIASNTTFDLIVMDYSADGSNNEKFTNQEILQIRNSGKKAISYISIGEAETYRFYWNENWDANHDGIPDAGAPAWLGNENPEWEGNYKVRFWNSAWQNIIFAYIDTLYEQGFNGIYMDIIDAYYYWAEEIEEKPYADSLMIQLVLNIRDHISGLTDTDFFIIPQNGEFIIEEANVSLSLQEAYFDAIDAIGVEDVFFIGDGDNDNPFDTDYERVNVLEDYLSHFKNVFSVEYLTESNLIQQYITVSGESNFVPYVTTRDLNVLNDGISTSVKTMPALPQSIQLFQNYPNPFNPYTTIKYELPNLNHIKIIIYDMSGRQIIKLVDEEEKIGLFQSEWNGRDHFGNAVASGIYIYKIEAGEFQESKKMLLIR